jgi:hypothetical protein
MAVSRANVQRLVNAAWRGMLEELTVENSSAEDVLNAAINIARGAILFACKISGTPEEQTHNRHAIRESIQLLLLDTIEDDPAATGFMKVM